MLRFVIRRISASFIGLGALALPAPAAAVSLAGLAGLTVLSGGLAGCENQEPKTALGYTADAKRAYDAAMVEFTARNWLEAQALFRDVKRKYSYSKFAKLAELRIADGDFEQEKFADAIRAYRQFIHDHRSDAEEVAYARSKIAEAEFQQIPESILLPAAEERDQASVMDAYKELKGFLHDYPNAKESKRMRELLGEVTARLVKHELYVARFYLNKDNYEAAVARIQYALRTFSHGGGAGGAGGANGTAAQISADSGLEPDALLLLGETYLKMHKWNDARQSFNTIIKQYPTSVIITHAQKYLSYMRERGV